MTKVPEKADKVITIINLQNPKVEITGFCDKIDKLKASRSRSRDLECPPIALPTCHQCSRYSPGCIVLECRLKADRPAVRVVQVLAEAITSPRNSRLPKKPRSTFDSPSRVTSRREEEITDEKSQDCTDDLVALPIEAVSSTANLKIDRSKKQPEKTKIYRPTSKKILEISYYDDRSRNQPMILIDCALKPCEKPSANVIQCSSKSAVLRQKSEVTDSPRDCEFARSEREIDISSKIKVPFSRTTCTNYPDSSEISSFSRKSSGRSRTRICPASFCQPERQSAIKEGFCKDFLRAKSSSASVATSSSLIFVGTFDDQQRLDEELRRPEALERMSRTESAKSHKAAACQRSTTAFRQACLTPGRISRDTSRLSDSQELLTRYREHIPVHQLKRYESCRSKRNGLQDECVLPPFLRTVLKKEKRTLDKCIERKLSVDRSDEDRDGMSESTNQTEKLFYLG